jgi:hypothetical protein
MLRINDLAAVAAFDQSSESLLPLDKWSLAQVSAVQPQKIKGEKDGSASPIQQLFENSQR